VAAPPSASSTDRYRLSLSSCFAIGMRRLSSELGMRYDQFLVPSRRPFAQARCVGGALALPVVGRRGMLGGISVQAEVEQTPMTAQHLSRWWPMAAAVLLAGSWARGAPPSTVREISDHVVLVRDDAGNWGGTTMGITHQVAPGYEAKKVLDLSGVHEAFWATIDEVHLSAFFCVRDYSKHATGKANGLDEAIEIVVNGNPHRIPTNAGLPARMRGCRPGTAADRRRASSAGTTSRFPRPSWSAARTRSYSARRRPRARGPTTTSISASTTRSPAAGAG